MEFADDGDLFQRITMQKQKEAREWMFSEQFIWRVFIQVCKGLARLHEMKILHWDMKSANVFMCKDGGVKLGDLNVSKVATEGLLIT